MIKVFYDDRCNLCSREIEYYKKISSPQQFNWCKLSSQGAELKKFDVSHEESLKSLHVINQDGVLKNGIDAFIVMWQQIPGWKWLAKFINLPVIYHISTFAYSKFANWRFRRLKHCSY